MNLSVYSNTTQISGRDSYTTVVAKNVIIMSLYLSINYINGTLVLTFLKHEIFTESPRYILFTHLVVNDMVQLTVAVMLYVIGSIFFTINASFCCFFVMIAVFTTLNTPLNLAGMAVERYIAICHPLHHAQICTVCRTYALIGLIWVFVTIPVLPDLFILLATEPLAFFHSTIYCFRDSVFHLPYQMEKKNIANLLYLSFVCFTLVYTYIRVMFAAKATGADARKAQSTILLHGLQLLLCMLTYIGPILDSLFMSLFPKIVNELKFLSYLIVQIMPRLVSPIVYGLRDPMFCMYLKRHFLCTMQKEKRGRKKTQPS